MKIMMSRARVFPSLALVAVLAALAVSAPACSSSSGSSGGDDSGQPGDTCSVGSDCGCWACTCSNGLTNGDGCVADVCPTGDDACQNICSLMGATFVSSAPGSDCPASTQ